MKPKNWVVLETTEEVAKIALELILNSAKEAILKQGIFKIVLAGGTTPEKVYQLLAKQPCDWQHWHFYLGDERCLPVDNDERNSQMIQKVLLNQIEVPTKNIHFIPAELGAERASAGYESVIDNVLPFDMVLLGMGEDGHTASLFPGHRQSENELVHAVFNAPKPPPERVSLSRKALSKNHHLIIMVTGLSKRESIKKWRNGENIPVSNIESLGVKSILLDKQAYSC